MAAVAYRKSTKFTIKQFCYSPGAGFDLLTNLQSAGRGAIKVFSRIYYDLHS
jgi:hypothetical protein